MALPNKNKQASNAPQANCCKTKKTIKTERKN